MFEKLKQAVRGRVEAVQEVRAHPGPADLHALPNGTARVGGLGSVPVDAVSRYIGIDVARIRPLDALGAETSSIIGDRIRQRMRDAGVASPDLEPGEIVPGQNAARIERMRAQGMSEEQLAMVQQHIERVVGEHQQTGWTIDLVNGHHASVVIREISEDTGRFAALESRYRVQHTRSGMQAMHRNLAELAVHRFDDAPYPAFGLPGEVAVRGRRHEAEATSSHLGTMDLARTLVALACLALHSLDG